MRSPFKFLDPYEKEDRKTFFGRDNEITTLYNMVHQSDLVLLYGPSGSGKTSLIRCGLANEFLDTDWLDVSVRRKDNLNNSLRAAIQKAAIKPIKSDRPLPRQIQTLYRQHFKPVTLIFDQFEELFILGSASEQQQFMGEIAELLNGESYARVLLSMREEYIARLYPYENDQYLPKIFSKRLRVEPMREDQIKMVISGTAEAHSIDLKSGVAAAIFDNLKDNRRRVQLAYLQVYLDRLWHRANQQGNARRFDTALVNSLGTLDQVMDGFLEQQIGEVQSSLSGRHPQLPSEAVQIALEQFVTADQTKAPNSPAQLAQKLSGKLDLSTGALDDLLGELRQRRILRDADGFYELAHDSLAAHIQKRQSSERKRLQELHEMIDSGYRFREDRGFLSEAEVGAITPFWEEMQASLDNDRRDFVNESIRKVARDRQLTRIKWVLSGIFIPILIYGINYWASTELRLQTQQTEMLGHTAEAQRLVRQQTDPDNASNSIRKAYKTFNDVRGADTYRQSVFEGLDAVYWHKYEAGERRSPPQRLTDHISRVNTVAKTADGRSFASGGEDGEIRRWQWNPTEKPGPQAGAEVILHDKPIHGMAYYDNNALLFSDRDGGIFDWQGKRSQKPEMLQASIENSGQWEIIAVENDSRFASGGLNKSIRLWVKSGAGFKSPYALPMKKPIYSLTFAGNNRLVAGSEGRLYFIEILPGNTVGKIDSQKVDDMVRINSLAMHGEYIAVAGESDYIELWQWPQNGQPLRLARRFSEHFLNKKDSLVAHIKTLAFNQDANQLLLASGGYDRSIQLWKINPAEGDAAIRKFGHYLIQEPYDPQKLGWITALTFLDKHRLVAGSADHTLRAWIIDMEPLDTGLLGE